MPQPRRTAAQLAHVALKEDEVAWIASTGDEPGFVAAMKGGATLVVSGTSARGTKTTDTYSLTGVSQAMAAIDKACP